MARTEKKKPKAAREPHSVPADPSKWSEKSQQTVSFGFIKRYSDISYECIRCEKPAVFSAEDQRYTYEVSKAPIDQRRVLCSDCWKRLLELDRDIGRCNQHWQESKSALQRDQAFLQNWLELLTLRDAYVPRRSNIAAKNMLRKLIG